MQSLKRWIIKKPDKNNDVNQGNINAYILRILSNRGINNEEAIEKFISPKLDDLYDPFLLPDMLRAVDMIKNYINDKKKIVIYGDYDADGITSTSILLNFFKEIGACVDYYIPDRMDEGYGLNVEAIDNIIKSGAELIITVDCGISSIYEVSYCKQNKVDIIITDHHECGDEIPDTIVIDAKRADSGYPFRDLSGAGIAFKLVMALKSIFKSIDPLKYIDLAAIGTVADVVSLVDENRIIVKYGIERIKNSGNYGILALIDACGIKQENISSGSIGFTMAPRINAAGRIADASSGVKLFTCQNYKEAVQLAGELNDGNKKRQEIEEQILIDAEKQIEEKHDAENDLVLVLNSPSWHVGVIGIVASRLVEKYYRPVILLSGSEGILRGSARSIKGFDIFRSLTACSSLLEKFGGHALAAGLSIQSCNLEAFREKINDAAREALKPEALIPSLYADCEINGEDITEGLADGLKMLEPYGSGNPSPLFVLYSANIEDIKTVGALDKHLKLRLSMGYKTFNAVAFNMGYNIKGYFRNNKIDILFSPVMNTYNGRDDVELIVRDMRHSPFPGIEHEYFRSLKNILNGLMRPGNLEMYDNLPPFDNISRVMVLEGNAPPGSLIFSSRESMVKDILNSGTFFYEVHIENNSNACSNLPAVIVNPDFNKIAFNGFKAIYLMDYMVLYSFLCNVSLLPDGLTIHNCCKSIDDDLGFAESMMPSEAKKKSILSYLSGILANGFARSSVRSIADSLSLNLLCVYYNLKSMIEEGTISMSAIKDDIILFRINDLSESSAADTKCSKKFEAVFTNLNRFKHLTTTQLRGSNNGY